MKRFAFILAIALPCIACEQGVASDLTVEKLPAVTPNLPAVPTLPPPPHPVTYGDGSYTVFGLRKKANITMDTDVEVTAYIVDIYQAPECPKGETCPLPTAPHLYLADTPDEKEAKNRLTLVGYAENQKQIDEAVADAKRGRYKPPPEETGLLPVPTDFAVGNKVKLKGRFARVSGTGFNISNGLLEYRGHETLSAVEQP
ncbi:MAG: hypothetical protein KC416_16010 [Myxococcales bacterium]|nr:hypothetical protein [Myxococcales bacterium]